MTFGDCVGYLLVTLLTTMLATCWQHGSFWQLVYWIPCNFWRLSWQLVSDFVDNLLATLLTTLRLLKTVSKTCSQLCRQLCWQLVSNFLKIVGDFVDNLFVTLATFMMDSFSTLLMTFGDCVGYLLITLLTTMLETCWQHGNFWRLCWQLVYWIPCNFWRLSWQLVSDFVDNLLATLLTTLQLLKTVSTTCWRLFQHLCWQLVNFVDDLLVTFWQLWVTLLITCLWHWWLSW